MNFAKAMRYSDPRQWSASIAAKFRKRTPQASGDVVLVARVCLRACLWEYAITGCFWAKATSHESIYGCNLLCLAEVGLMEIVPQYDDSIAYRPTHQFYRLLP